jgi:hypothetical protein
MASPWPFAVQRLVARATGDQGLPARRSQTLDPQGFVLAAWSGQVREPADVMDCALLLGATEFPGLCQEPLDHLTPMPEHRLGLVVASPMPVPAESHPAKPGDQRRGVLPAFVAHRQYCAWAMGSRHRSPIRVEDVMQARAMCMRERLAQREGHAPVHPPETMGVGGHAGGLPQAPIFRLGWRHEVVIRRVETRCHVGRCAVPHVVGALRAHDLARNLAAKRPVATRQSAGACSYYEAHLGSFAVQPAALHVPFKVTEAYESLYKLDLLLGP